MEENYTLASKKQVDRLVPTRPKIVSKPLHVASLCALTYIAVSSAYIFASDSMAEHLSGSLGQLHHIENMKGIVFVVVSGAVIFGMAYFLLRRIADQTGKIYEQQAELVAAEGRVIAVTLAASVAHDLRNMITATQGYFQLMKPDLVGCEVRLIEQLAGSISSLASFAKHLSVFGQTVRPKDLKLINMSDLVTEISNTMRLHPDIHGCQLTTIAPQEPIEVTVDKTLFTRMLSNLLINAAQATDGKGRIEIRMSKDEKKAHMEVHDDGPGIPVIDRTMVFQPYFTTKHELGTGLGLMSVKGCVEEHRGTVDITDSDLGGACFKVSLPLAMIEQQPAKRSLKPGDNGRK